MSFYQIFTFLVIAIHAISCVSGRFTDSNCADNRVAIVHLFEWKWNDIAAECERFLGPMGYCGVQVSPPSEHIWTDSEPSHPWWVRYQPISYKLNSRSGTEAEFASMVSRCNAVNVRIYADAVINHMAGVGRTGIGSGGSFYDSNHGDASFPEVPFDSTNFNTCDDCGGCCCIDAWMDHDKVRNCPLSGLIDINLALQDSQTKVAEFLNRMIGYGVAGFRIDAGKHMYPDDLDQVFSLLDDLNTQWFDSGSEPFIYLEVLDMDQNGEIRAQEYTDLGLVTEFRYCIKIMETVNALWSIGGLYDPGWGMLSPSEAFVFVDNHDNQRGHGSGSNTLTFKNPRDYKKGQAITLANDYGYPRVMSSYDFTNTEAGPPSDADGNTNDIVINSDGSCAGDWVCEHRWQAIAGMASFAKATNGQSKSSITASGNTAYFHRGNKGFFAVSNDGMNSNVYTGLPGGTYCNVVKGCPTDSGCASDSVTVDASGYAQISISNGDSDPMVALHVEALSGSGGCTDAGPVPQPTSTQPTTTADSTTTERATTTAPATTTTAAPDTTTTDDNQPSTTTSSPETTTNAGEGDWQRTVIFINAETMPGNDLFYNGGISHDQRGCSSDATAETSDCALSIQHNELGTNEHYESYNAWRVGDTKLDWYNSQEGQGSYNGQVAMGSPAVWTTNDASDAGYQQLNTMGPNFWMVDFEMNCDETEDGWFEVKSFVTGWGWESDVSADACTGSEAGSPPYTSSNHFAKCGQINTFYHGSSTCVIDSL